MVKKEVGCWALAPYKLINVAKATLFSCSIHGLKPVAIENLNLNLNLNS